MNKKKRYRINWENVCFIAMTIAFIWIIINGKSIMLKAIEQEKEETIKNESVIRMNCDLN